MFISRGRIKALGACLTVGWACLFALSAQAQSLKAPFAVRASNEITEAAYSCPALVKPLIAFDPPSRYAGSGPARDEVNAEADAAYEESIKDLRTLMSRVTQAANAFHSTGSRAAANCAASQMAHWAKADALGSPGAHQAYFKLATSVAGLSLAVMQIDAVLGSDPIRGEISAWLNKRAKALEQYFTALKSRSGRNNHRAWGGLAVAAAGIVANDRSLLDAGFRSYQLVVCQATAEGVLPLELERGAKALDYHLYSLAVLTQLAEIGERNGLGAHALCDGALARVVAFTVSNLMDPTQITKLAGKPQDKVGTDPSPGKLSFLDIYGARFPDRTAAAGPWLRKRPLGFPDLGGNQTLLYGKR